MKPMVSVVIATYNYGRFLVGAIESALDLLNRLIDAFDVDLSQRSWSKSQN